MVVVPRVHVINVAITTTERVELSSSCWLLPGIITFSFEQ